MKSIVKGFTLAPLLFFAAICSFAEVRLPAVFSDNMVLQQQSAVAVWGWSAAAEKIYVTNSWSDSIDSTQATGDARWKLTIQTPSAGGPHTVTIKGSNTIVLKNVMIGEVWICSGQSNMQWSGTNGLPEIAEELPRAANANIRFFQVRQTTSEYPQDDCPARWTECSAETLQGFSAVAYFFGKQLQEKLNVPIGLIDASWGGTPAEVWTPKETVENDPVLKAAAGKISRMNWWPNMPGAAYNAMIAPLTSFNIAGAIWYQGESNVVTYSTYDQLMRTLIGSWRKAWNKDIPFYYVQIAPFRYGNRHEGALLREAQTKTLDFPKTGMAVITDLVEDVKDIHPRQKKQVGQRLAAWALAETYAQSGVSYKSPLYSDFEVNKNKVTIHFKHAEAGLMLKPGDKRATEFYIAGEDRQFVPADVKIEADKVVVSSRQVKSPVAVRFGFSNAGIGNIFNKAGLPVAPFRTDDWQVDMGKETYE